MKKNLSIYDYHVKTIDGNEISLAQYKGKTLLIVNVANRCGFTKQYEGLEQLYRDYKEKNFVILGFPCNQFGSQEPGTETEIKTFCESNYQISFPLFAKIEVNGSNASPLYTFLKEQGKGILNTEAIKWNFTKFLIDAEGKVLKRYAPTTTPEEIKNELALLLDRNDG